MGNPLVRGLVSITLSLLMVIYIIADCYFRDKAFEDSNRFAAEAQEKLGTGFFKIFFIIFCDILHPIAIGAILMVYYAFSPNKIKTLAFFLYFFLITYLCSIIKMIYHNPRPYWVSPNVQALECYSEYGNPSGHSMMSVIFFVFLWHKHIWGWVEKGQLGFLSIWQKEQRQMNENLIKEGGEKEKVLEIHQSPNKTVKFCIFTVLTFLIVFFILFGRIFLGMHSYNEVFLGFFYGVYFIYMYLTYIEDYLVALLHAIIAKNAHDINENMNYVSWMLLGLTFAIYMAFLLIPIIAFELSKSHVSIPEMWYLAIRNACPGNDTFKMFYYKCFLDCGVISTGFGILFGILFTKGKHSIIMNDIFFDPITEKNVGKLAARALIILVVSGGVSGIFNALPNHQDIYLAFFVNMNLGTLLGGFALIKVIPFLFSKCKIDQEGDFLKYEGGEMVLKSDLEEAIVEKNSDVEMSTSTKGNVSGVKE